MRFAIGILCLWSSLWASAAMAQSFRGLPYFVKIESLKFLPGAADQPVNQVQICYRFASTVPLFDYSDLASQILKGVAVKRKDSDGGTINGDSQPRGVEYQFNVRGFNFYGYLNSEYRGFQLSRLEYFNSFIRSNAGENKPIEMLSFGTDYRGMIDPQYEWVTSCERLYFGKAYSERYVRSLFRGPGPIGSLLGQSRFEFNATVPIIFGSQPAKIGFSPSEYVVPVFGPSDLQNGDYRMISLSHYVNSLNAVRENLDEKTLNDYLQEHQDIVRDFEVRFGIHVDLPIDAEKLVNLIKEVAGIENLPPERSSF